MKREVSQIKRSEELISFLENNEKKTCSQWFIGLIFGDGNIYVSPKYNRVSLAACLEIKQKLEEQFSFGSFKIKRCEDLYNLYVDGKEATEWFKNNFQIEGPKSSTIRFPKKFKGQSGWHFLRGLFDADGCVYVDLMEKRRGNPKISVSFSSKSTEFVEDIRSFVAEELDLASVPKKCFFIKTVGDKKYTQCNIKFSCQETVKKIYKKMYQNHSNFFLSRKKNIFEGFYEAGHKRGRTYEKKQKEVCQATGLPIEYHQLPRVMLDRYRRSGSIGFLKIRSKAGNPAAYAEAITARNAPLVNRVIKNHLVSYCIAKHDGFKSPSEASIEKPLEGIKSLSEAVSSLRREFQVKPASWFPVQDAVRIIEEMKSRFGTNSILDPFSGWGCRYSAAHMCGVSYLGVDANQLLVWEVAQLTQGLSEVQKQKCQLICENSYKYEFPQAEKFDSIFTCPPYWKAEDYGYKISEPRTYSLFLTYQVRLLQRLWQSETKVAAISVEDFSYKGKKYPLLEDYCIRIEKAGFNVEKWCYRSMYRSFNKDYRDLYVLFVTAPSISPEAQ